MIEIKNKHMILFPEDRLIGAQGDVDSSQRKFFLDKVQDGFDLSDMIAWIKIEPLSGGEDAYDQLLKKEIADDKIYLTWKLTGLNLKNAGELSAQIIFADPKYFNAADLDKLKGDDLIVPAAITGVSAPVWQSYCETFVVAESIDDTIAYKEVTKNILVAAVAEAANAANDAALSSEQAQLAAETAQQMTNEVASKIDDAQALFEKLESCEDNTLEYLKAAEQSAALAGQKVVKAEEACQLAQEYVLQAEEKRDQAAEQVQRAKEEKGQAAEYAQQAKEGYEDAAECVAQASEIRENIEAVQLDVTQKCNATLRWSNSAAASSESAQEYAQSAQNALEKVKNARDYRLIYKKTLSEEDTDCYSFEITEDNSGLPFKLTSFVIYFYAPQMANIGNSYISIGIQANGYTSGGAISYSTLTQFAALSKSKAYYSRLECNQKGRWYIKAVKGTSWNQNVDSLNICGNVCSSTRFTDGKAATAIWFAQGAGVDMAFPAGTMVEVWGVDAIEEGESDE